MPLVYLSVERDLLAWQKRPADVLTYLRSASVSKETYLHGKRGLLRLAYLRSAYARYVFVSKETYNRPKET